MVSDDERREVAERMRISAERYDFCAHNIALDMDIDADYDDVYDESHRQAWLSLADLIYPGDTSHGCRDTVTCDPTGRGVDSIYDWCRECLEGADGAEDELCCAIMRAIEDYRHPELATAHTVRAVDREAMLNVAESMDSYAGLMVELGVDTVPDVLLGYVRRIREACGEVSDGE